MTDQVTLPEEVENVRPLNTTQVRNLTKLVTGDFAVLREQLMRFFADKQVTEEARVRAESQTEDVNEIVEQARQAKKDYEYARTMLKRQAEDIGLELLMPALGGRYDDSDIKFTDTGLNRKLAAATQAVERDKKKALSMLQEQEHAAMKKVFLSGITGNAEKILDGIPSAESLLANAMGAESAKELT